MNESVFILLSTADSELCIWECKEQAALNYPSCLASMARSKTAGVIQGCLLLTLSDIQLWVFWGLVLMWRTSSVYSFMMFSVAQPAGTHWCVPWVWRRSHRLWPHLQVWHRHWCLWHQVSGWGGTVLLSLLSQFKGWFNTVPPNNCVPALSKGHFTWPWWNCNWKDLIGFMGMAVFFKVNVITGCFTCRFCVCVCVFHRCWNCHFCSG